MSTSRLTEVGMPSRVGRILLREEVMKTMAEQGKTYVCTVCGQEVAVVKAGVGTLVCCNQPMQLKS